MFEGVRSWSLPSLLDLTSEWIANCTDKTKASTCTTAPTLPFPAAGTEYPWANLFQLLDGHSVTWKYYLSNGDQPDCDDGEMSCAPKTQSAGVPSIWNPARRRLPGPVERSPFALVPFGQAMPTAPVFDPLGGCNEAALFASGFDKVRMGPSSLCRSWHLMIRL